MKRFIAILCLLALGACSTFQTATVPTVKAQQAVDFATAAYKADLRAEVIYLSQPACGLPRSPPAPLCASYAVGTQWKAIDTRLKAAIILAQAKIDTLGADPKAIDAALGAIQLVLVELETFTSSNGVK